MLVSVYADPFVWCWRVWAVEMSLRTTCKFCYFFSYTFTYPLGVGLALEGTPLLRF